MGSFLKICVFRFLTFVIISTAISQIEANAVTEDTCQNQLYQELKQKLIDNYDSFDVLYQLHGLLNATSLPKYARTTESVYVQHTTQECQHLQTASNRRGGNTCPGRHETNRDVNRVPCVIREFKCLCRHCILPDSLRSSHRTSHCKPIYHYMPVMRRSTRLLGGIEDWIHALEPLVVGCKCVPPGHNVFSSRWGGS